MRSDPLADTIAGMLTPLLDSMGLRLWGVSAGLSGRTRLVQVFLEDADPAQGVDVDRLAEVSRHLGLMLEVDESLPGPYRLEVSSPGFERPFFGLEQMVPYVGRKVELRTEEPLPGPTPDAVGRKVFRGELRGVDGEVVQVEADGALHRLEWSNVRRAKLVVDDPWQYAKEHGPKSADGGADGGAKAGRRRAPKAAAPDDGDAQRKPRSKKK